MNEQIDSERAEFEAWADGMHPDYRRVAWSAWQAARAKSAAETLSASGPSPEAPEPDDKNLGADVPLGLPGGEQTAAVASAPFCAPTVAQEPAPASLNALLASRDFYEVMYSYRCAPSYKQAEVVERFEAVKDWLRTALASQEQPPQEPVAWITGESIRRLRQGGNDSRGSVPIHACKSNTAKIALYLRASK